MWLNSKEAAEILGVNIRKLQRIAAKAQKESQKILTINTKIFSYKFIYGIGRGGKTLPIWIDDTQLDGNGGDEAVSSSVGAKASLYLWMMR